MTEFKNVTIKAAANVYFDGKVTSRTIEFTDGSIKTLGIMLPGEYEFSTNAPESMEIISGKLEVLLPNTNEWLTVNSNDSFKVIGNSKFQLKIHELTDYCCTFIS